MLIAILAACEKEVYLPHAGGGHWLLHAFVTNVAHLARVQIEDLDGTILLGCCNILVIVVEPHGVGWHIYTTQSHLGFHTELGTLRVLIAA